MNAQEIMDSEDFRQCVSFHGHICPGLSIGYRAAKAGLAKLKENRAEDEEIVAIVETDACSADAVQVMTGCTFGKGNFVYRDYGKMGLTLFSRKTGEGVRVAMRPGAFAPDETHFALLQKVMKGEATEEETTQFRERHMQRSRDVLTMPEAELFTIRTVTETLPAKAVIAPSETCEECGEPVMRTKLEKVDDKQLCRGCLEQSK